MRAVAGIVVGLVVSLIVAVIAGIVALGATFSLPPGIDATDVNSVVDTLKVMPQSTELALAAAWFASAVCGAAVAKLIAHRAFAAWAVALVVAAYFGLNAVTLSLPTWVLALWIVAPLLGGLLGSRLFGAEPAVVTTDVEAPPANP